MGVFFPSSVTFSPVATSAATNRKVPAGTNKLAPEIPLTGLAGVGVQNLLQCMYLVESFPSNSLSSFLYALWDVTAGNFMLGVFATFLPSIASSFSSLAFIVLPMHSFKSFPVNWSRYQQFSRLLSRLSLSILFMTPVLLFASLFNEDLADSPT